MNFIVTGATGFIGTHLTNLLKEKYPESNVYNLDLIEPGTPLPTIKHYRTALCEGKKHQAIYVYCDVRKPIDNLPFTPTEDDVIFNFAAIHRTPGHPDYDYFETNIRGAENVCAFAEKYGIRKILFTSSISPYGPAEELKTEETLPTPNVPYGISKLVAEKIFMAWQAKDKSRQLTILRPGVVFGKGENGNFTRLYFSIRSRKFMYPGRKDTIKACIYVKELVNFMLYQIQREACDVALFNCTYEPAPTIERIVETMKEVTGLKRYVPLIPSWILMSTAAVLGFLGSPMGICPARVRKLMVSTNVSGQKMKNCGYTYKYTLSEAMEDWFRDNGGKCLE